MNQELTFEAAAAFFKRYGVEFSEEKYCALGISQPTDKLFTNLSLILSDQCAHTIKVAVFGDDANTVFKDNKEFISIGGLLPGLSPEDIRSGISQPRNKKLAEVFHRLHLIESYGTGIRKIFSLYAQCAKQPRIEVTQNTFKMILPNMNATTETNTETVPASQNITPQMEKVLAFIDRNGKITEPQVQELLNLKRTRSYTLMKQMADAGLTSVTGRGANKYYTKN